MLRNTTQYFGGITKGLHGLLVVLLTMQFILIWRYNSLPKAAAETLQYMLMHKSVGITILMLGILFIIWKIINTNPSTPGSQPHWQQVTAKIVHGSLLILMVIMPITGYALSCAAGKPIGFFGLFTLPHLIPENKNLVGILETTHEKLGILILILVGMHVLAALYHHFILKDIVLKRMLPFTSND